MPFLKSISAHDFFKSRTVTMSPLERPPMMADLEEGAFLTFSLGTVTTYLFCMAEGKSWAYEITGNKMASSSRPIGFNVGWFAIGS